MACCIVILPSRAYPKMSKQTLYFKISQLLKIFQISELMCMSVTGGKVEKVKTPLIMLQL